MSVKCFLYVWYNVHIEWRLSVRMKKKSLTNKGVHLRDNLELWLMALPGIIFLLMFNYFPMYGLVIAFKNYIPIKGIGGSQWNGLKNFEFFFTSIDAPRVLRNTLGYSLMFILVDVFFGLAVAIALYNMKSSLGRKVYNTIMILPRFLSMVLVAYMAYGLLSPSGVINTIFKHFGMDSIMFYNYPKYWPFILTIVHIWGSVGMNSIMYLSALSGLDTNLVEAAKVDGANWWEVICNVYVPYLYPTISVLMILAVGKIFAGDFGLFYQLPMDKGVLYPTTDILPTYVYRGLANGSFGPSTAVGLFQSVAGCIMVVVTNLIVKKISPENSLF